LPDACTYVLLAGLPGTGKSTIAAELSKRFQPSVILNKDDIRAALFPGAATDYSEAQDNLCVKAMLAAASYLCTLPESPRLIFFDGRTFSRASQIEQVTESAEDNQAGWLIVYLWCADEIALARLAADIAHHPAKNRDAALYMSLKQQFQSIQQPHLSVDTGRALHLCVEECVAYLAGQGHSSNAS
jgi:adenylylsulfate kinase